MKKKIFLLAASNTQLPIAKVAKNYSDLILCDSNKNAALKNFGKKFYNISTTDKKKLLQIAKKERIDGCITYASDPSAEGVGFINSKLKLNGNKINATSKLQNKFKFRNLQKKLKIFHPNYYLVKNLIDFFKVIKNKKLNEKILIKPTDGSGSKGITKISKFDNKEKLRDAFILAKTVSREKKVIIESYLQRQSFQIAGDGFYLNKKKILFFFAKEHFSKKPKDIVPVGESYPHNGLDNSKRKKLEEDILKIMNAARISPGPFNIDAFITNTGKPFIIELGPRSGGNLIPELIEYSYGFKALENTVRTSLGLNILKSKIKKPKYYFCSFVIHSTKDGYFKKLFLSKEIKKKVILIRIFRKKGEKIYKFSSASTTVGLCILKFKSYSKMINFYDNYDNFIKVETI